jgi:hypothetical protein
MRRLVLIFALLMLAAARAAAPIGASAQTSPSTADDVKFTAMEVYVDPHGTALAAYQVQINATAGDIALVGIEGGEHPAFSQPPYYDKRAILDRQVILAAYSTAANLPSGKTRVATLMVRISGKQQPKWSAMLMVAGSAEGRSIDASVTVAEASGGKSNG